MAVGLGVVLIGIGVALLLAARPVSTALAVGSQLRVTLTATFMDYARVQYALYLADDADPGRSAAGAVADQGPTGGKTMDITSPAVI